MGELPAKRCDMLHNPSVWRLGPRGSFGRTGRAGTARPERKNATGAQPMLPWERIAGMRRIRNKEGGPQEWGPAEHAGGSAGSHIAQAKSGRFTNPVDCSTDADWKPFALTSP